MAAVGKERERIRSLMGTSECLKEKLYGPYRLSDITGNSPSILVLSISCFKLNTLNWMARTLNSVITVPVALCVLICVGARGTYSHQKELSNSFRSTFHIL